MLYLCCVLLSVRETLGHMQFYRVVSLREILLPFDIVPAIGISWPAREWLSRWADWGAARQYSCFTMGKYMEPSVLW